MPLLKRALDALLAAYDTLATEPSYRPDEIAAARADFLTRFSPDELSRLQGDALLTFFHGNGQHTGLFYELEFGKSAEPFGNVAGGSALKFKIYRGSDGLWKKKGPGNVPIVCTESDALQMTADIAACLDRILLAAQKYHLPILDRVHWGDFETEVAADIPASHAQVGTDSAVGMLGWAHKYLAIARHDLFSTHHQPRHLAAHLIRLGESPDQNAGRYLMDWHWLKLRTETPELADRDPVLLSDAAYHAFGQITRYWRVGTDRTLEDGGKADTWETMKAGGFASIGWDHLGDLRIQLAGDGSKTEALNRLKKMLSATHPARNPSVISKWAAQIYGFYTEMRPGDRIAAMKGSTLLGVGEIAGDYYYDQTQNAGPHIQRRPVQWHEFKPDIWPDFPGYLTTVNDFTDKYTSALHLERALLSDDPIPQSPATPVASTDAPPPQPSTLVREPATDYEQVKRTEPILITPLTPLEQRIKDILERKGQVILYGPPGTGKTYNGLRTARELLARERCQGRSWATLTSEEQAIVDNGIEFVTFHPAYTYEEFIEGYRPTPPGASGGMPAFERRDGLFVEACDRAREEPTGRHRVLLIDEINRGNVAAVLGELITLLESDKRDTHKAILPLSRRPFTVPANLWVVGTMNTADRSISLLDAALRRRFGFVELLPEPERLGGAGAPTLDGLSLSALLSEINARVRKHITRNARDLQVGHAYLMRSGFPLKTKSDLLAAMRDDILPLLAEYCFENYAILARILGDDIIDTTEQTPVRTLMEDPGALHKALLRLVGGDPARTDELDDPEESTEESAGESGQESAEGEDTSGEPIVA